MREIDECYMEEFDTLDSSEKTIAILGDRWWPQAAKQEGDNISKTFICNTQVYGNNVKSAQLLEVSLLRVGTLLPSRKGCVVNDQITKASNK